MTLKEIGDMVVVSGYLLVLVIMAIWAIKGGNDNE